jgi:hypothetical protein
VANGISLSLEHRHPKIEEIKGVKYVKQRTLDSDEKLEFKASYQDISDAGIHLRMQYKDPKI